MVGAYFVFSMSIDREMEKQYPTRYPSDVSGEEWAFVALYLTLCREDALSSKPAADARCTRSAETLGSSVARSVRMPIE